MRVIQCTTPINGYGFIFSFADIDISDRSFVGDIGFPYAYSTHVQDPPYTYYYPLDKVHRVSHILDSLFVHQLMVWWYGEQGTGKDNPLLQL